MTDIFPINNEIIQHAIRIAECTDKMLLLNSWKCIWSEIWKCICFSLMAFSFWPSVLFGDGEYNEEFSISFSAKILTTSSISALFCCSFFYHFLSFPLILGTVQSQRTYICTTFWSPKPLHKLLELSIFFCCCNDMFADFRSTISATFITFKRPSFARRDTKNVVFRPSNNIGAVSCTRFFQNRTIIPHQRLGFFKHSFNNTQRNSIYSRVCGWYW